MLELPTHVIEGLTMYCESKDYGMIQVGSEQLGVHCLVIGSRNLGLDKTMLIIANMLISGVISGEAANAPGRKETIKGEH